MLTNDLHRRPENDGSEAITDFLLHYRLTYKPVSTSLFNRIVKYYCKPVVPGTHNGAHYAGLFLEDKIREPETNSTISTA
jgi:hypothetical protein